MNAYNPNYFNRSNVNSMKNALRKIIVSEQFPGSEQGQPGMSISGISDLELQKRMRNKKNTSIFSKNPKQSDEYLELEREFNRRNTPQQQAPMGAMPVGQQPTQQAQQAQPIGSSIPTFDINKPIGFGMPQKSPVPQNMFAAAKREAAAQVASGQGAYSHTYAGLPIKNQEMIPPSVDPIMSPQTPMPYGDDPEAAAAYERNAKAALLRSRPPY